MNVKLIADNFDQQHWNSLAVHPLQSWEWGEARKEMGLEVIRLGEFVGRKLTNVFQLTVHKIPYTDWSTGYLPRSPFPSKQTLDFLGDYSQKHNIISVKLEPYTNKELKITSRFPLIKSKSPIFPEWTQIIDLKQNEEQLLKKMKPKTRYNLRLAQKKGVSVKEQSDEQGFEIFLRLYFATTKRQNYYGHDINYHRAIWSHLKLKIAHLLIASYQDIPLAAYELFHFKNGLYYVYGGSSEQHRNVMAAQLIMWESIKFGQKVGAKYLDMWGSLEPSYSPKHPWAGFTRFKEGYGGKFVKLVGSYDLVVNEIAYKIFALGYNLRNNYLIWRGKFR